MKQDIAAKTNFRRYFSCISRDANFDFFCHMNNNNKISKKSTIYYRTGLYRMVGFKLKSRVARYKNNCHHIILTVGLEYIYLVLSTLTDDECL